MTLSLPPSPTFPGFKVDKLLGTGGMGSVYYAIDEKLQRPVALKVINSTDSITKQLEEARAQAKVSHPNVAQIYDIIEHNGLYALVIEYVEGKSLFKYIREKQLSLSSRLHILFQVSKGLTEIHSKQIIHRDIKPDNILVTPSGQVKIIDFGIAQQQVSSGTAQNFGRQIWLAPEVLKGKPASIESDIYSFGLLAVFLLLENPINNFEPNLRTLSNLNEETSPLPTGVLGWLKTLTKEKPHQRPRTMAQVGQVAEYWYITLVQQESGQILTEQLTEALVTQTTAHWPRFAHTQASIRKVTAGIIVVVIASLLTITGLEHYQQSKIEYVAVMPIDYQFDKLTSLQQLNVKAAIRDTIHNTINENEHTYLISADEVNDALESTPLSEIKQSANNATQSALAKVSTNTGSTLIINTKVECTAVSCLITLYKYQLNQSIKKWQLENSQSTTVSMSRLNDLAVAVIKNLSKLLPASQSSYIRQVTNLPDQVFNTYIQTREAYDKDRNLSDVQFERLANLITQHPYFIPAYWLYMQGLTVLFFNGLDTTQQLDEYAQFINRVPREIENNELFIQSRVQYLLLSKKSRDKIEAYLETVSEGLAASRYFALKANISHYFNAFEEAIHYYQRGLELRYSQSHLIGLATMYWYTGNIEQARVELENATQRDAYDYTSNEMLAKIYLYQGEYNKTLEIYQRLLSHSSDMIDFNDISIAYMLAKNYSQALKYAQKSVEISPENESYLLTLAELLELSGDIGGAQRLYKQIIEIDLDEDDITQILSLAQAYAHLGNTIEAIKMINRAQAIATDSGAVSFSAALVFAIVGEINSAIVEIETALEKGIGKSWFSLPWFKTLCSNTQFERLNDPYHLAQSCTD